MKNILNDHDITLSKISGIFVFLSEIKFILNDSVAFFVGLIILH